MAPTKEQAYLSNLPHVMRGDIQLIVLPALALIWMFWV